MLHTLQQNNLIIITIIRRCSRSNPRCLFSDYCACGYSVRLVWSDHLPLTHSFFFSFFAPSFLPSSSTVYCLLSTYPSICLSIFPFITHLLRSTQPNFTIPNLVASTLYYSLRSYLPTLPTSDHNENTTRIILTLTHPVRFATAYSRANLRRYRYSELVARRFRVGSGKIHLHDDCVVDVGTLTDWLAVLCLWKIQ